MVRRRRIASVVWRTMRSTQKTIRRAIRVRWDQKSAVYYELFKPGETVNVKRYRQQLFDLNRSLLSKRPEYQKKATQDRFSAWRMVHHKREECKRIAPSIKRQSRGRTAPAGPSASSWNTAMGVAFPSSVCPSLESTISSWPDRYRDHPRVFLDARGDVTIESKSTQSPENPTH